MAFVFQFDVATAASADRIGMLTIFVSRGNAAAGEGVADSGLKLAHKLRQAGLPGGYSGVIAFSCQGYIPPMSMSSIADELRAAGWHDASFEVASAETTPASMRMGGVVVGPLASRALQAVGARAFTIDGPMVQWSTSPTDNALYAHEKVHESARGPFKSVSHQTPASEDVAARAVERMVLK